MKPTSKERRDALVEALAWLSYVVLALPFMVAAMYGAARLYMWSFSLVVHSHLSNLHAVGFAGVMILAIPIGLAIGGWIWAVAGRFVLRFPRSAVETIVFYGPGIPVIVRYNTWCLNLIYGKRQD